MSFGSNSEFPLPHFATLVYQIKILESERFWVSQNPMHHVHERYLVLRTHTSHIIKPCITPLKFNMEPENQPWKRRFPFGNPSFSGSMLNFGGVYYHLRYFITRSCSLKTHSLSLNQVFCHLLWHCFMMFTCPYNMMLDRQNFHEHIAHYSTTVSYPKTLRRGPCMFHMTHTCARVATVLIFNMYAIYDMYVVHTYMWRTGYSWKHWTWKLKNDTSQSEKDSLQWELSNMV